MKEREQRLCWLLQLGLKCRWDSAAQSTVVNGADTQQMAASTDSERKNKIKKQFSFNFDNIWNWKSDISTTMTKYKAWWMQCFIMIITWEKAFCYAAKNLLQEPKEMAFTYIMLQTEWFG